jgi:molecular chaperone GrpE
MAKKEKQKLDETKVSEKEIKKNVVPEAENGVEESEIDALNKKLTELNDRLLRTLAELENTRRRSREDLEKSNKYAVSKFASDLIPVMENFYLAMSSLPEEEVAGNEKVKGFYDGIKMTQSELNKAFEKHGIVRIYPIGEAFNHDLHQAIAQVPSDEKEGTVVQVLQAGYVINDRLLRPALVGVATSK